jgi:hypothetical protein
MTPPKMVTYLKEEICKLQNSLLKFWGEVLLKEQLITAWLLLEHLEQTDLLLRGLGNACENCPFDQDLCSMCPEIRTSSL